MAQLVLNIRESSITKETPFYTNFGRNPNIFRTPLQDRSAESAIKRVETWKRIYDNIIKI